MNVVPLIDILLVLLVIFMIIPCTPRVWMRDSAAVDGRPNRHRSILVSRIQVFADGTLRINQDRWLGMLSAAGLRKFQRARVAHRFIARRPGRIWCGGQSDRRHAHLGIASVGLLTPIWIGASELFRIAFAGWT